MDREQGSPQPHPTSGVLVNPSLRLTPDAGSSGNEA
jgi:hypothetical protein